MISVALVKVVSAFSIFFLIACHDTGLTRREKIPGVGLPDDLFSISAPSSSHIVVAGYWGAIYVSTDGGVSWKRGDTGTRRLIYDVSMADERRGFACGQRGLLLRTDDGGLTWKRISTPKDNDNVHFFSVHAVGPEKIWVVGEWGTRLYSADGGDSFADNSLVIGPSHPQFVWLSVDDQDRVRAGEPVFEDLGLTDVWCLRDQSEKCWIVGEFGTVFSSRTGGMSGSGGEPGWLKAEIVSDQQPAPISFSKGEADIGGEQLKALEDFARPLLDTPHLNLAIQPRLSRSEISEIEEHGDPYSLLELADERGRTVQYALESVGLLSDRVRQRGTPPWDYEEYLEDDPSMLSKWFVSRRSDIPRVDLEIVQSPHLFSVRFSDPLNGVVSALGGVVLRSTDGGKTWRYTDIGRKGAIFSAYPVSSTKIMAVGEKGLVRISEDGGATWARPGAGFPTTFTFFRDMTFIGPIGFVVGQGGTIFRTTNSGEDWSRLLPEEG